MSSVDERVVEMRFDNAQFEQGVSKSLGTLDRLKSALNFGGAKNNLDSITTSFSKFNVGGAISGLNTVVNRFSALGIMGDQVLRRLTDGFIQLSSHAASAIKSLTIDQIGSGFTKYAQKTEAVQTIMNATGKSIDEVSTVLDKLNVYTDETSYNFTDMVSSIGKFTSAGVDLEVAEGAMEGIANWAATAGVGPAKAASAFYNLSQAISAGAMKMQDWKSINLLNMGTKQFKETAIQTALELGKLTKGQDGAAQSAKKTTIDYKNFDQTLHEGWLDTDVLLATLTKYADQTTEFGLKAYHAAQEAKTFNDAIEATKDAVSTGWSKTFELLFGNYEEAKELWTNMANEMIEVFAGGAEERNRLLKAWHDLGGYEDAVEALSNAWEGLKGIGKTVKEAFTDIFPPKTHDQLLSFTSNLKNLTKNFKDLVSLPEMSAQELTMLTQFAGGTQYEKAITNIGKIKTLFSGLFSSFSLVGRGIKTFFSSLSPTTNLLGKLGGKVLDVSLKAANLITAFNKSKKSTEFFTKASEKLVSAQVKMISWLTSANHGIKNFIGNFSGVKPVLESAGKAILNFGKNAISFISNFRNNFSGLGDIVSKVGQKLLGFAKGALAKLGDAFNNFISNFSFEKALNVLTAGGGAALVLMLTNMVGKLRDFFKNFSKDGSFDISGLLEPVKDALDGLGEAISSFTNSIKVDNLKKIATAVLMLAAALLVISAIDMESLINGLFGLGAMMAELVLATAMISKYVSVFSSGSTKAIAGMIGMAAALLIMSGALKVISSIDSGNLANSLLATITMLAALTTASALLSKYSGKMKTSALGLIGMAASVVILASAVKSLSQLSVGELVKGVGSVVILIGALTAFEAISKGAGGLSQGLGMLGIAASLKILVGVVNELGSMSPDSLVQGVATIGAVLAGIAVLMQYLGQVKGKLGSAASIMVVAASLTILSGVIQSLGSMSEGAAIQGIAGMGAALLEVALVLNYMKGTIGASASLLVASAAILVLSGAIAALGAVGIGGVLTALVGLAGAFAIIGVAGLLLGPLAPAILAVSGALLVAGAAIALAGAGFIMLGAGLASMAASAAAGAAGIVVALATLVAGIGVIGASLVGAVAILVSSIAGGLAAAVPAVVSAALTLVLGILAALAAGAPAIVSTGIALISGLINAIASQIGPLVSAGLNLIVSFINGMAVALDSSGPMLISAVSNLVTAIANTFITGLQALVAGIPVVGDDIVSALEGLKGTIDTSSMSSGLESSGQAMGESLAAGVESGVSELSSSGEQAAANFASGVSSGAGNAESAGQELAMSTDSGINAQIQELMASGELGGDNFATGLLSMTGVSQEAGTQLGDSANSGLSPSIADFMNSGETGGFNFASGLSNASPQAQSAGAELSTSGSEGASSTSGDWMLSGGFLGEGLIKGILSKVSAARSAGATLAKAGKEGADSAVDIASPSKAMIESGEFFGEGWIIGISSMIRKAFHVGEDIGNAPLTGVSSAMSSINEILENGIDANPTITPVIDLSEVRNGINQLHTMTNFSMGSLSPSIEMPRKQQSLSPTDFAEFLSLGNAILREIQNGSDLYLDDGVLAGRINRRLGTI